MADIPPAKRQRCVGPPLGGLTCTSSSEQHDQAAHDVVPTAPTDSPEFSDDDRDEFHHWAHSLFYSHDLNGQEQLLDVDGTQIMMEWEREYMERCVDRLDIDGNCDVLEIGFGCAYSANRIQAKGPRSHTIIEMSEPVLKRLREWASDRPNVRIVEGTWQERLPDLGKYDRLFFDDYGEPGPQPAPPDLPEQYRKEYSKGQSHFTGLLGVLLRWHSQPGARVTGYCLSPVQVCRSDVEVSFETMTVKPSANCTYFSGDRAVVPLFIKTKLRDSSETGSSTRMSHHDDGSSSNSEWSSGSE